MLSLARRSLPLRRSPLAAAALIALLGPAALAQPYQITRIPIPAGHESIFMGGLNNLGQVAGTAFEPFDPGSGPRARAFVWSPVAGTTLLPRFGTGEFATASDINDSGIVVGNGHSVPVANPGPPIPLRPLRWVAGVPSALAFAPGPNDVNGGARAINSSGVIAGVIPGTPPDFGANLNTRAARWTGNGATLTPLAEPARGFASIDAINDAGVIVGASPFPGPGSGFFGIVRPYRWDGATATPLSLLGMDPHGRASDINTAGAIVGVTGEYDDNASEILGMALLWPAGGGAPVPLSTLGPVHNSAALSINDAGRIVGHDLLIDMGTGDVTSRAVVWLPGATSPIDLNTLIDPASPGWILHSAMRINNTGQIVGAGLFNGEPASFFANPVPAPGAAGLLIVGVLSSRRRRG